MDSITLTTTTTVLGKRSRSRDHVGVLHLASSPEPTVSEQSDFEFPVASTSSRPVLINGKLVANPARRYQCTHPGCGKAYTKPSRLEEHERAHTGERPFVCETCNKSYLRETHLQAHVRSHLPESSRPLACDFKDCQKRFWTSQHLKIHQDWHNGAKPFACVEEGCDEAFSKHHQLRAHICEAHAPPGTKPYRCDHEGCDKSFNTNQHLKTHKKTHNAKRYTCVQPSCLAQPSSATTEPTYFPTWTALQHHIRTAHPPACTHPSCNGHVFASQKGLRSHQKLHEQRDAEVKLRGTLGEHDGGEGEQDEEAGEEERPNKRARRGGEIGRDWKCDYEGCDKDFKSKKALNTHRNVTHLGKRDFVCAECSKAFGYKHLLQRHTAKIHAHASANETDSGENRVSLPAQRSQEDGYGGEDGLESDEESNGGDDEAEEEQEKERGQEGSTVIDLITGKAYADKRKANPRASAYPCPYPDVRDLVEGHVGTSSSSLTKCDYSFSRLYDLCRHLLAAHDVETTKERLQEVVGKGK